MRVCLLSDEWIGGILLKLAHLIGWTNTENILDGPNGRTGSVVKDATATDVIEEWALHVAAPGPSLRSGGSSSTARPGRVQIQNCQIWVRELVSKLVEHEILPSDALDKVDAVPKN